jgi:hypothetical protein
VSGVDFAALGTGMDIRQALDVLQQIAEFVGEDGDGPSPVGAVAAVRTGVEELETRLNTARRTAWVAVPVEWQTVNVGDVIVGKDGTLMPVLDASGPEDDGVFPGEEPAWRLQVPPERWLKTTDPARQVPVLRRPTADALDILTRQLGAQVTK